MKSNDVAIHTVDLTCRFGTFTAVDHLALSIPKGTIYGFIGSNGSGKSTAIRMLCGLLRPSEGHAYVLGYDTASEAEKVKQRIGYMSQKFSLYLDMTVYENLSFYASLYGLKGEEKDKRIQEILKKMFLEDKTDVLSGGLSGGQKRRLALGCAILHRPELLILDEPTSAVDPTSRRQFWNLLSDLAAGGKTTIMVTTHFMDEAEHCDEIGFLQNGRLIIQGSPQSLKDHLPANLYVLRYSTTEEAYQALKESGISYLDAYVFGRQLRVLVRKGDVLPSSLQGEPSELTMEDVFIYYDKQMGGDVS